MIELLYEQDMQKSLIEYGKICENIDELTEHKNKIRDSLIRWMEINKLTEHETVDGNDDQLWKLSQNITRRVNIDKDKLRHLISEEQYDSITTHTESKTFKCVKIKKKSSSKKMPQAPVSNKK